MTKKTVKPADGVPPKRNPHFTIPGGWQPAIDTSEPPRTDFIAFEGGDWGSVRLRLEDLGQVTLWGGRDELLQLLESLTDAVRNAPARTK